MRGLLHSRRGSVTFGTIIALIPLIGVVALGGEAGSWYVTRQHAQNAADAAAVSGAMQQLCLSNAPCAVTQTVDYRAKQAAAQNAFCNAGGTSYPGSQCSTSLPAGVSQTVTVASLASWNGTPGTYVQATAIQQQPAYLAQMLGLSTVNIGATAVASVKSVTFPPCVLSLIGSLSFQGSPNINAPNCGMASNDPAKDAINFTGGGMTMNLGSLSTVGGCTGTASFCDTALKYLPAPTVNPFSALDGALTTLCGANPTLPAKCGLPACPGSDLVAYVAGSASTACTNNNTSTKGNTAFNLAAGVSVYFISGTLTLKGGSSITCNSPCTGVTFILLPGASIDTKGGGTLTLKGPATAPSASSLPAALQSSAALFQYMSMYDASATAVTFGGNSNINLTGNIYAPNAAVTFQGDPTIAVGGAGGCGQLIAASIAFNGNATFDTTGCPSQTKLPKSQYVQLVQ
ncbi:pilus assembly protein TadG-related protein [Bradyrhizobium sp. CCGUVB1N3]|uniref:pilus assembly protein TadG-related protein n=1 Tax=Bradyrhizobium sp. CCGUVB1N3 TaxID=2949629 RepID=UPI0020B2337D|nr:pilus assembly protein TadG-related protein [Bradyrhizobium sp. CCGUVB1N3]MCP3471583.1 pilus assembly protein TadG-related protein [Bradyrhizobium sp. CCGUVB1N3]